MDSHPFLIIQELTVFTEVFAAGKCFVGKYQVGSPKLQGKYNYENWVDDLGFRIVKKASLPVPLLM
jgi:hypothetical protein